MAIQTSTLRPGLLVSIKSSLSGGPEYNRIDIEKPKVVQGTLSASWKTEKKVDNVDEYERAEEARLKARAGVARVCANTAFGRLCPEDKEEALSQKIKEGHQIVDEFNATAKGIRVSFGVMTGRIAQDDVSAIKAIKSEMRELIEDMQEGIKNVNATAIRAAASRLLNVGQMISPKVMEEVKSAVETARATARVYVKAGEQAAVEVDRAAVKQLTEVRRLFLDLDETKKAVKPKVAARAVDHVPEGAKPTRKSKTKAVELDLA